MKSKIGKLAWNYSYICRLRNIVRKMDFRATCCEIRDYFYNLVNFCHDIDHGEPPISECGLGNSHSGTGFVPRQFKMTNNRDAYDVATDVPAEVRIDMLKWLVYAFGQDIDFHHATELLTRHINEYRGCLCEGMPYSPIEVGHVWH